jgi:hypothetical protein
MAETTVTTGSAYIQAPQLATQADIARLEAKIDRLLAVLNPPKPSSIVEFIIDETTVARAVLPHLTEAAMKAAGP